MADKCSIAKFTAYAILKPALSDNRTLTVRSFTASQLQILEHFEIFSDTGNMFKVHKIPLVDYEKIEKELHKGRDQNAILFTMRRMWVEGKTDKRIHMCPGDHNPDNVALEFTNPPKGVHGPPVPCNYQYRRPNVPQSMEDFTSHSLVYFQKRAIGKATVLDLSL